MSSNDRYVQWRVKAARPAGGLLLAAGVESAVTLLHAVHGAATYHDPGRLHLVAPVLVAFLLVVAATVLALLHPGRPSLTGLVLATTVPFAGLFGLYHGGYGHLLKLLAFHHGMPEERLRSVFGAADFAVPGDLTFELTGLLAVPAAAVVVFQLVRLVRMFGDVPPPSRADHLAGGTGAGATAAAGRATGSSGLMLTGLALRMLFDAPVKSLGTLLGVVVSVFLMAQQSSLLTGILGRVTAFVESTGADLWITSLATESTDATDSLPAAKVGAAAGTPGVAWAAPVVQGIGRVTRPDGVQEFTKVLGVEAPRYAGLPRSLAPGSTASALRGPGRILLNWNDRPTFAAAEPGDRVEIDGQAVTVAGFFQGMDPHSPYYYVFANIDDARAITGFPLDRVTFIAVGAAPGQALDELGARLQARLPNAMVKTSAELSAMEERYFLVRTPVGLVFGAGSLIAALIGAAIVAVTLYSTAIDRARDYGTLKAIGARRRDLLWLLLAQAWIFAAVGYLLGMSGFFVVRHLMPALPLVAPPRLVLGVAVAALASCTLASLAAIRRVLQLDAALVFRS